MSCNGWIGRNGHFKEFYSDLGDLLSESTPAKRIASAADNRADGVTVALEVALNRLTAETIEVEVCNT